MFNQSGYNIIYRHRDIEFIQNFEYLGTTMGSKLSVGIAYLPVHGCVFAGSVYLTFLIFEYLDQKPLGLQS